MELRHRERGTRELWTKHGLWCNKNVTKKPSVKVCCDMNTAKVCFSRSEANKSCKQCTEILRFSFCKNEICGCAAILATLLKGRITTAETQEAHWQY